MNAQTEKLVTKQDVLDRVRVSAPTLRRWIEDNEFPRPIVCGRTLRWDPRVIEAFIAARQPMLMASAIGQPVCGGGR